MKPLIIPMFLLVSTAVGAKDLGFYGEPTPALAMYAAQTSFAVDRCVSEGYTEDAKSASKLLKQFNNLLSFRIYQKKDEDFRANLEVFLSNYRIAWDASPSEVRREFCSGFNEELNAKSKGWLRWIQPVAYFRATFSPTTEASKKRYRRIAGGLSVFAAAATTAASVSAGNEAIASAKAGNFSASNHQMAASRYFNQAGASFVAMTPYNANHDEVTSVLEEKDANGTLQLVRCPVVDHFFSYPAPIDSGVWTTYQQVSIPCRDLTAADLQRIK